jgi:hypothetical protein
VPSLIRMLMPRRRAMASAATIISAQPEAGAMSGRLLPSPLEWQNECWGYYDDLGMYRNAVTWKADMLGRVRLRAAKKFPDNDEPTILDKGPAADLIAELTASAQSQIMASLAVYLSVPGEGYLVGETIDGHNRWSARSADEIRYRPTSSSRIGGVSAYEVIDENQPGNTNRWRPLAADSLVVRVWRPHKRYYNIADSSSRAARSTMRELELANREFAAHYMSRLASAGAILFPSEAQFPVRPEFKDAADPFVAQWIDTAAQAIKTPGSAAAAIPMPWRLPAEFIEKVKLLEFGMNERYARSIEKRDQAIKQLAVDLDCPPEALLGLSDANHWTGWLIEEAGFKIYLAPDTEVICGALTTGYLHPRLAAAGEDTTDIVVWYDASEITQRPDKSTNTLAAYDRGEASGKALRREFGLDEDDMPDTDELTRMILWKLASNPQTAASALYDLTGVILGQQSGSVAVPTTSVPASGTGQVQGPPEQPNGPPTEQPSLPAQAASLEMQLARQGTLGHAIQVDLTGTRVLHPGDCAEHIHSCPVTHATWGDRLKSRPGVPGVYACWLDEHGAAMIGHRLWDADVATMLPGSRSQARGSWRPGLRPLPGTRR